VGFVVDKAALGQVFSEYFGFPCQFSFHRLLHMRHHLSSGAGTIGQLVADVPSGLSLTPTQKKLKGKNVHGRYNCFINMKNMDNIWIINIVVHEEYYCLGFDAV
jgi:hypothetical protein